jgi:hypothetical protein
MIESARNSIGSLVDDCNLLVPSNRSISNTRGS